MTEKPMPLEGSEEELLAEGWTPVSAEETGDDFDPFLSDEEMEVEAQRLAVRRLQVATLFFRGYIEGQEAKDAIDAICELLRYEGHPVLDGIALRMRLAEPGTHTYLTHAETLRAIREETDEEEPTLAEIVARSANPRTWEEAKQNAADFNTASLKHLDRFLEEE